MKFTLKDYQTDAVRDVLSNLGKARKYWHNETDKSSFSLTAVTGAGKTVMAAAVFEALFHGNDDFEFDADPGAVVIWFSDDPSLNEQTRFRLMEASDRLAHTALIPVENMFNQSKFDAKKIYFLNTQKLGKNSLLVRGFDQAQVEIKAGARLLEMRPDQHSFTIWDTIQNTIEDPDLTLYLLLDEAHRGMGTPANAEKSTIVQRLINGTNGVPGIPVVLGISATVKRFNDAMEAAEKRISLPNVVVDSSKVQESGLIKDTILLDIPDEVGDFDTVLIRRGTDKLKASSEAWAEYTKAQGNLNTVVPLMVLQAPNTPNPDDIGRALDTIYREWPELANGSVAHVFGDHTTQQFGNRTVPYISPERVQDSTWVRVLIAKDAISTGWDCPRAEVMVSFRAASDRTHITQLLGRMVRSPLARRIPGHERLNTVDCLLPRFNKKTVEDVVKALMTGDDTTPPSGRVLVNPVEMKPNPAVSKTAWELFEALPCQTRPQRGAKPAKRLTALAHELASDGLLENAGKLAHAEMHKVLDTFQETEKAKIEAKRKAVLIVDGKTVVADLKNKYKSFDDFWEDADMAVINDAYKRASRIFTPDLSRTYADYLSLKVARPDQPEEFEEAIVEARVAIAALGLMTEVQAYFDAEANKLAKAWLEKYKKDIKKLADDRREAYRQIVEMSAEPQDVELVRPDARFEPTKVREKDGSETDLPTYKNHALCDEKGKYPANLNDWEITVVETETKRKGFVFWYRNPQYPGQSSLGIAYLKSEQYKIVRPDFIFFSNAADGSLVADIVDPHGLHLSDALPKLQGLSQYAETHAPVYRRIESVAAIKAKLRVLDLTRADVRDAIAKAEELESLFAGSLASDYE
jgi:superfamily II DNA or RNA helicase